MTDKLIGRISGLALRSAVRGPMDTTDRVAAEAGGGMAGDVPSKPHRGVTFLATEQWGLVTRELGADLPWHTRRANVLVEASSLAHLIGRTIQAGQARIRINSETDPCGLMDEIHTGLREALTPDCRGGVYGEVLEGGEIRVGDTLQFCD